jgi:tetratricopeptide (TPR) repeat protein
LAAARQLHNLSLTAFILTGYGELVRLQGDYDLAAQLYREAMALAEELHQKPRRVMLLHNLAYVVLHNGAPRQARQLFQQCLALGRELPDRENFGMCLLGLGAVATVEGDQERAARLFGAGEQVLAAIGAALAPADQAEYDRYRTRAQASSTPDAYAHSFAAGQLLTTEAMEALALG